MKKDVDNRAAADYIERTEGGWAANQNGDLIIMATEKKSTSRYTQAQEARIREVAGTAGLNQALAQQLATEFGFTEKSVTAKANRMGVKYNRKVAASKTGGKIEKKEDIVLEIEGLVGASLDGLEKASKLALQRIRDRLEALDDAEDETAE